MEQLKNYIFEQVATNRLSPEEAKRLLQGLNAKPEQIEDDIAIIGMSCKFPGANNVDKYWENMLNEVTSISIPPLPRRKAAEIFFGDRYFTQVLLDMAIPKGTKMEDLYTAIGYMEEIDKFDAAYFGISPKEAKFMEPLQRVFLETAWEAVEDAGYSVDNFYGTKTGVFLGRDHTNFSIYQHITEFDQMHLTGSWTGILATRISYLFNLQGPGLVIDTACSSGLTSIHEACRSLKSNECEMALAGGIHIVLIPAIKGQRSTMTAVESGDNKVRTFDNNANGTVWGEGAGVVLLKPLSKAIADGDNIYAVIKGSAINNDGASNGITAPNADAQEAVIIQAWENAKIDPSTISYIEAHGTGTVLGDPIETKGLTNAFRKFTDKKQFCGIGSVKTNFGHLVAASGLASLIKVVLSMKNKMIPATVNFEDPNRFINFCESPLFVNDKLREWKRGDAPLRAGVSAFGFSGTNCHVVLEEAPELPAEPVEKPLPCVLTVSARNEKVLTDFVKKYAAFLTKTAVPDLRDLCYTSNTGRGHFTHRLALIVNDYHDLKEKMSLIAKKGLNATGKGIFYGEHKVIPDIKKTLDQGEITEEKRREITKAASALLQKPASSGEDYEKILHELCTHYIGGANVVWGELYKDQKRKRVSVPVYPLERISYWAEPRVVTIPEIDYLINAEESAHPLLDRCLADTMDQQIYLSRFNVEKHWVIKEHRIMKNYVMPGTGLVELVIEISKRYLRCDFIELKELFFINPVVVKEDETKDVQTVIKKAGDHLEFVIMSKNGTETGDENWVIHAEGKSYKIESSGNISSIDDLKNKCNKEKVKPSLNKPESPMEFGPRWDNIDSIYIGENELFVYLELSKELQGDIGDYTLHPSLLDNSLNITISRIPNAMFLPYNYPSLKVYGKMPGSFYSYIRQRGSGDASSETISFDISLIDENGKVFAEAEGYTIKKVHVNEMSLDVTTNWANAVYELTWIPVELKPENMDKKGNVLVFKDEKGVAENIIRELRRLGREVIEVEFGAGYNKTNENKYVIEGAAEDYKRLCGDLKERSLSRIIHLSSIIKDDEIKSLKELENGLNRNLYSLFHLTRALVAANFNEKIGIVLVVDNANEITKTETRLNPHHAPYIGLGKVIPQENEKLICKYIDIDENTRIDQIVAEIDSEINFGVAYRKGIRYLEELRKADIEKSRLNKVTIKSEGVYIITGGAGGIGLEICKRLASQNNVNLALINRSKMPLRKEWEEILEKEDSSSISGKIKAIKEIEAAGSHVFCYDTDIADEKNLTAVISELREKFGTINGVIHCAGVAGDGFIVARDPKTFKEVIAPKVLGTWLLDKLTEKDNPEFFVMFSSMIALTGGLGQGDYTAANSFLNSFAKYRNQRGKKTISISWPAWKEAGMAKDYGVGDAGALFKPLSTNQALHIFEGVLSAYLSEVFVGELNYETLNTYADRLPVLLSGPIKDTMGKLKKEATKDTHGRKEKQRRNVAVMGMSISDTNSAEYKLAQIWGQVLELEEIDVYLNFHDLGGDSILATELIKEIDKEFPGVISISDIFTYPSIIQLSEYMKTKLTALEQKQAVKKEAEISDEELMGLLDDIEAGKISLESGLEVLLEGEVKKNE